MSSSCYVEFCCARNDKRPQNIPFQRKKQIPNIIGSDNVFLWFTFNFVNSKLSFAVPFYIHSSICRQSSPTNNWNLKQWYKIVCLDVPQEKSSYHRLRAWYIFNDNSIALFESNRFHPITPSTLSLAHSLRSIPINHSIDFYWFCFAICIQHSSSSSFTLSFSRLKTQKWKRVQRVSIWIYNNSTHEQFTSIVIGIVIFSLLLFISSFRNVQYCT